MRGETGHGQSPPSLPQTRYTPPLISALKKALAHTDYHYRVNAVSHLFTGVASGNLVPPSGGLSSTQQPNTETSSTILPELTTPQPLYTCRFCLKAYKSRRWHTQHEKKCKNRLQPGLIVPVPTASPSPVDTGPALQPVPAGSKGKARKTKGARKQNTSAKDQAARFKALEVPASAQDAHQALGLLMDTDTFLLFLRDV